MCLFLLSLLLIPISTGKTRRSDTCEQTFEGNIKSITGKIKDNAGNPQIAKFVDIFYTDTSAVHLADTTEADGSFFVKRKTTGVKQIDGPVIPDGFALSNNYPNPFNPSTNIEFSLPSRSHVTLKVFDLLGREIGTFADGDFNSGKYKATLELNGLANGVYFAVFHAEEKNKAGESHSLDKVQKLLLLYGSQHNTNPVHEAVKVGEVDNVGYNNSNSAQTSNPQSTSFNASNNNSSSSPQHLSKTTTSKIDSLIISGPGITRTKLVDIPVSSDSIDLGTLVVNSAPKQSIAIPNQILREVLDSLDLDLNQFVSNDNATQYASQNSKILVVGSHAKIKPDSSDMSGNFIVRAYDAADTSLFVDLAIPLVIQHPSKLIVGPVYDLFTKFTGRTPIQGMKVVLGSDPSNNALTDADGMAVLKTWKTGKDSIFVVGATSTDTAFYFWHNNRLNMVGGDNIVKAFNDSIGIPTWHRFSDPENGDDAQGYLVRMSEVALYWKDSLNFKETLPRFRDEDLPAKVWMNRSKAPGSNHYADSIWAGLKKMENSRLKFTEVTDSASAIIHILYTNENLENGENFYFKSDAKGPYLSNFDLNFAGPPTWPNGLPSQIYTPYLAAHGISRAIIQAYGMDSPFKKDILFNSVTQRYDAGFRDFGSEKERIVFEAFFLLERNPKLLDYFK